MCRACLTLPPRLQRRNQENILDSLREAVHLSPTNGLAFAQLARQVLAHSETDNPRRLGEADFFSRYALKWAPNDPEVVRIPAEIEVQVKRLSKP